MSVAETMIAPRPAPPRPRRFLTKASATGYIFLLVWFLMAAVLLSMMIWNWDTEKFVNYGPRFLRGLSTTLWLVGLSVPLGAILSLPLAFARMSHNRLLSGLAYSYVYVFRGTPLLAQLFLIYYGLGQFRSELQSVGLWWIFRDANYCGLFALTINTAAYQAEILRGALQSVPKGQHEAAASLGISKRVSLFKVILPQALIVALRPYGNEIILLIKGSAVVSIVTVLDLMGQTRFVFSRTLDYQSYLWAAIFYLLMVEILRNVWNVLEDVLTRHLKR